MVSSKGHYVKYYRKYQSRVPNVSDKYYRSDRGGNVISELTNPGWTSKNISGNEHMKKIQHPFTLG